MWTLLSAVLSGLIVAAPCAGAGLAPEPLHAGPPEKPPDEEVAGLVAKFENADPSARVRVLLELEHLAYMVVIGRRPDPSGRAADDALLAIEHRVRALSSEEHRGLLVSLSLLPHDRALAILVQGLDHEESSVRRQAAESLLGQARYFATFPEMPKPLVDPAVFRATKDHDAEVARDCACVLRIVLSNLEAVSGPPKPSALYGVLASQVSGVPLDSCY